MPNKLFRFCPKCGHSVKRGTRFCPKCGYDMMQGQARNYQPSRPAPVPQYPRQYRSSHTLTISLIVAVIILIVGGVSGYMYHEHDVNTYLSNQQRNSSNQNNSNTQNNNQNNTQSSNQGNSSSNSSSNNQHPNAVKNTVTSFWKDVDSVANQYGSASDNQSELGSFFVGGRDNSDCHSIASWAANITSNVKIHAHVESIHFNGKDADVTTQVEYDYYSGSDDHSETHTWHCKMVPSDGSYRFVNTDED